MNIGYKIYTSTQEIKNIGNIENVLPVNYCDDGEESWYEVCEADKTSLVAIIGEQIVVIIDKNEKNVELLLDLI